MIVSVWIDSENFHLASLLNSKAILVVADMSHSMRYHSMKWYWKHERGGFSWTEVSGKKMMSVRSTGISHLPVSRRHSIDHDRLDVRDWCSRCYWCSSTHDKWHRISDDHQSHEALSMSSWSRMLGLNPALSSTTNKPFHVTGVRTNRWNHDIEYLARLWGENRGIHEVQKDSNWNVRRFSK